MSTKHYDLADIQIRVGNFVVYAASWGRCPVLKYGIVTRLAERKDWRKEDELTPTIRVISVDRSPIWINGKNMGFKWELQKDGQEIALGFMDRLLVVDTLPTMAKRVLLEAARKANAAPKR